MAQRLFESEVQAHPTNISEHLTSVLFPFPQCNRNDMSIIHGKHLHPRSPLLRSLLFFSIFLTSLDMLKDILESGAIKKHIFDRCDLIASSSIHFCRGVLPKAFASDYDSYLTSDRAFPSTNEDSDTSYSKRKNKRKKEKKSKKDKKKKKRRKSDKKEEGEVTPEEDLDPDSEQDYEEEEEDDCSDDHWRGAKSSSTRTTSHSQTPLQSPPSKRHVYVIPHRSNRSRERSPRKSKSSNSNRI